MRHRVSGWWSPPPNRPPRWRCSLLWELPVLAAVKAFRRVVPLRSETQLYREIAADCYCCFGVSARSGSLIRAARELGRPSLLFLTSNDDLEWRFRPGSEYRTPYGEIGSECHRVLMSADEIIAQSTEQQELLASRFDRTSTLLRSPFDIERWDRLVERPGPTLERLALKHFVLWIGRADRFHKRPHLCLEVARLCPEVTFLMLLNAGDPEVTAEVRRDLPPNVQVVARIPFEEMPAVFSRARALLSTGARAYEGAPQVFLQAAATAVPIASLEVDGEVLSRIQAGRNVGGNITDLARLVKTLWTDDDLCRSWGQAGRQLVASRHSLESVVGELLELVDDVCTRQGNVRSLERSEGGMIDSFGDAQV